MSCKKMKIHGYQLFKPNIFVWCTNYYQLATDGFFLSIGFYTRQDHAGCFWHASIMYILVHFYFLWKFSKEIFFRTQITKTEIITSNTTVQNDTYFRPKNRYQPNSFVVLGHWTCFRAFLINPPSFHHSCIIQIPMVPRRSKSRCLRFEVTFIHVRYDP